MRFCLVALLLMVSVGSVSAQKKKKEPPKPQAGPALTTPVSLDLNAKGKQTLKLVGKELSDVVDVHFTFPTKSKTWDADKGGGKISIELEPAEGVSPGLYAVQVLSKAGLTNVRPITVDDWPSIPEAEGAKPKTAPMALKPPVVVRGIVDVESSDCFRIPVEAGVPVVIEAFARRLGSPLDPVILLHDEQGREMAGVYADDTPGLQSDARVVFTPKSSGTITVELRDATYLGGANHDYRLRIGKSSTAVIPFPTAIERGSKADIGFVGTRDEACPAQSVQAPKDLTQLTMRLIPKTKDGLTGMALPLRLSSVPQSLEKEPNEKPAEATAVPMPGGVSARFATKADQDVFRFPVVKGRKYRANAVAAAMNLPTEVYIRIVDEKGIELGKSNPTLPTAFVEFTAAADGSLFAVCEHLNYLAGPTEVYRLELAPVEPDFAVTMTSDRVDVPLGGVGLLPLAPIVRTNGFNGPITLRLQGDDLSEPFTIPAGAEGPLVLPVSAKGKPRLVVGAVLANGMQEKTKLLRPMMSLEFLRGQFSGLTNPPEDRLTRVAVGVVPAGVVVPTLSFESTEVALGGVLKGKVTIVRADGHEGEVTPVIASAPAGVTIKTTPIVEKGTDTTVEFTIPANLPPAPLLIAIKVNTAADGKAVSYAAKPIWITIVAAKKPEEPKKKP